MIYLVKKLIHFNIFIALCAVALSSITFIFYQQSPNFYLLIFVFSATLLIYNIDRKESFKNIFLIINVVSAIFCGLSLYFLDNINILYFVLHLALIAFWYALPKNLERFSLRRIPLLKLFLIAYCWTQVSLTLPLLLFYDYQFLYQNQLFWLIFLGRFCFLLAITLPFDIGDYKMDLQQGIQTFPTWLGVDKSKILAFFLVFVFFILSLFAHGQDYIFIHIILCFFTIFLIWISQTTKSRFFYKFYLDGLMLLYFLILVIFTIWK